MNNNKVFWGLVLLGLIGVVVLCATLAVPFEPAPLPAVIEAGMVLIPL